MSGSAWNRLEELFHRAAEIAAESRGAFLDSECAGDAELRAEIESLLSHDAPAGSELRDAIRSEAEMAAASQWPMGRRIGAYRVTGIVAEGGMGAVYRAVRDDDQYRKEAAIKLVRRGLESAALVERFRAERQILASLEHPSIARLLDGGTTGGLPYIVMELIDGVPITRYADDRQLGLRPRLRLFQQVCEAVEYAHRNFVVHRDLKPANILVTSEGVPKLIDFGIAKLANPDDSAATVTRMAPWTPDYASPEQVLGRPATARADVYALGLILFEMLTGRRAQIADRSSPAALERSICEAEIPPASSTVARPLARRLAGDLDTIIGKATRKDSERRYGSAGELAEDIRRYLDGGPVRARKDSRPYRAAKFLRRNGWPVAAAAAIAASLGIAVLSFTWRARPAGTGGTAAAQTGGAPSPNAEANQHYLTGLYWRSVPTVERLRRAEAELRAAIALDPGYDPAQAALAEVYGRLYFTETVSANESLGPARAAAAKALQRNPGLAASHEAAALVRLIDWDWAGAEHEYRRAIELDPEAVRIRQAYAQLYLSPALRYREAISQLRKAIALDPVNITLISELGVDYRHLGDLASAREQLQKSLEFNPSALGTRTELAILDEIAGDYTDAARKMETVYADGSDDAWVMGHFGYACAMAGRTADARRILQRLTLQSHAAMHIAAVCAGLGENEAALDWLERGVVTRSPSMFWLKSDFRFARLHPLARFQKLLGPLPR